MQVKREELLNTLESLTPGLAQREIIEQSNAFVFSKGRIFTYNDDVTCSCKSPIKNIEGAVEANSLLAILRKLKDKEIEVEQTKAELVITGKRREAGIRMSKEILLPIKYQKATKAWKKLPKNFKTAISLVKECASTDESRFDFTCIHITPKFIEATDNQRAAQYKIKTNIDKEVLIRASSLQHIISTEVNEFFEQKNWIHFRDSSDFQISCLRYMEDYQDTKKIFAFKGTPITLPKSIRQATETAEIFSSENPDNRLIIELQKGKVRIKGQGTSGWFWEVKRVKYKGPSIIFTITPKLFMDLLEHDNHCEVVESKAMKITGDNYMYVTVLGIVQ